MADAAERTEYDTPETGAVRDALTRVRDAAHRLASSDKPAFQAQSVADARSGAETALTILDGLDRAVRLGATAEAVERARALRDQVTGELAGSRIQADIQAVIGEANAERDRASGNDKRQYTMLLQTADALEDGLQHLPERVGALQTATQDWAGALRQERRKMANEKTNQGVTDALTQISRQLSFLVTNSATAAATGTSGAGRYPSVGDQLMASLDALALPHDGVQFRTGAADPQSTGALIDGLLDNFRPRETAGLTIYEPGRTEGRPIAQGVPPALLGGAARVAARKVRDEADIILEILDRLPDMTRFQPRAGLNPLREARHKAARRFEELDGVMQDALGVNLPRATSLLDRAIKAVFDFFDYANLELEFFAAMKRGGLAGRLHGTGIDDEVSVRPAVVKSEEITAEIREVVDAFARILEDIRRPIEETAGRVAAVLERQLEAVHASARDLRAVLVRHGTSRPEQDLVVFTLVATIRDPNGTEEQTFDLSVGQFLDWAIEATEPHVGGSHLVGALEALDIGLLANELARLKEAADAIAAEAEGYDYALRIAGPMRQFEELARQIGDAAKNAATLAGN